MNSHSDFCTNRKCKTCNPDTCPICGAPCILTTSYGQPAKFQGCDDCYDILRSNLRLEESLRKVEYNKRKYGKES